MTNGFASEPTGSPAPLVLVHGYPLDSRMWRGQAPLAAGRQVIAPDLPGFGAGARSERRVRRPTSARSGQTASGHSMGPYAAHVLRAMDEAGIASAVLCGLSMGGYILFEIWRRAPERVRALILSDTRAEADSPEARAARDSVIALVRAGSRRQVTEGMLARLLAPGSRNDADLVKRVQSMMEDASDDGLIAALESLRDRPDSVPALARITVPVLILVGEQDALTPVSDSQRMHDRIRGSRLVTIPEAGHLAPLEKAAVFNSAVAEFLAAALS